MPTFPEDIDNYIANHIIYPQSAIDKGIQGTVNVKFIITKTGEVTKVSVLSGVSPDLDSEAVRVISNMPPWNPGMKDGKPVNVEFDIPVPFQLKNGQNQQQSQQQPQPNKQEDKYGPKPQPEQNQAEYKPKPIDTTFILRDGLYLDPYIGYGEGGPNSSASTTINMGSNIKFGVGVTYMLPSNIGISVGLQLQQYDFNYTYSNIQSTVSYDGTLTEERATGNDTTVTAGYNENVKYSFMYAQVPVLCRYISSQEDKPGFYAEAGFVINYLVSSRISGTIAQTQYQLSQSANTDWYLYNSTSTNSSTLSLTPQDPARLTLAIHAAAGAIIPFNNKISLILAVSPDVGIMNAGDGSKDEVNFGASKFYLYGNGTYGSFNSYTFDAKLLIKLFGSSRVVRIN